MDLMTLVVATAVGLAGLRRLIDAIPLHWAWRAQELLEFTMPLLAAWTLAVAALQLRRPRPPLRRLARRPGFGGGIAAGVGLLACAVRAFLYAFADGDDDWSFWGQILVTGALENVAPVMAATWLMLALGRSWHRAPDWAERTGRLLGWAWLVLSTAYYILHFRYG